MGSFMAHLRRNLESTWPQLGTSCPQFGEKFLFKKVPTQKVAPKSRQDLPRARFFSISVFSRPNFSNFRPLQATILIQSLGGFPLQERRRGKPLLQGSWRRFGLNWFWDEDFTKALDHLSPEAGGISKACALMPPTFAKRVRRWTSK